MDEVLLKQTSAALRKAALNEEAKAYLLSNPVLFQMLKRAAERYIGGETLEETVEKVKQQNGIGFKCSIEFMGESTRTAIEANEACEEFLKIVKNIKTLGLYSGIALDLSHIGLAVSKELCLENLDRICRESDTVEVAISAEGIDRTDDVLNTYQQIARQHENVAITLQAYLHRTKDDLPEMMKLDGRIRLVKGAFETPPAHALSRGTQLDQVYLDYAEQLLANNHRCSIATHHHEIQQHVKEIVKRHNVDRSVYEFESLYGIQNEQLLRLKEEGHPAKIYFVYGKEWYLYLCNRLAEYPQNVFRALVDIVK